MGTTRLATHKNAAKPHNSDDYYTPPWLLERVTALFGPGWFDPCPPSYGAVPTINGLAISWPGKIFVNPPYSHMYPWVAKFAGEAFGEGIMLAPAYTDTRWFQPLFDYPILFTKGRIRFVHPDGTEMRSPPFGAALVYRGQHAAAFADAFGDLGRIVMAAPLGPVWRAASYASNHHGDHALAVS